MILRLRGDAHEDLDWPVSRPPSQGELIKTKTTDSERWYRVANVIWAFDLDIKDHTGYDVGLILSKCPAPDLGEKP